MEGWPSVMTPTMGTWSACCTSRKRVARSSWVSESKLRARSISPERQSRRTQRTSWPTSGWRPARAKMPRPRACVRRWRRSVSCRERTYQCVVTLQEIGDRPWGYGHAARDQRLIDCRDTSVVAGAPLSNEGHNIKAKFMLGECQGPFFFGPIRLATLRTSGVEAAPALEREPQDCCKGGDGTVVMIGGPHRLTTGWAMAQQWL